MSKKSIFGKLVSAVLPMFVFAGIGPSPVPAYASTVGMPDVSNLGMDSGRPEYVPGDPGMGHGRPDHVPPVNAPIDTPAFFNGLTHPPYTVQFRAPSGTLPGDNFGRGAVVPIPAAVWLFGSGLLGLIGIARCKTA